MHVPLSQRLASWFILSREERAWLAGLLAIFLVGLMARWWAISNREPAPVSPPAGIEEPADE